MRFGKLFNPKYWKINKALYKERYEYDLKFNASFRGIPLEKLRKTDMPEIYYLNLYRKCQASIGTIWARYYLARLKAFSRKTGVGLVDNLNLPKGLIIGHIGTIVISGNASFSENLFITHGVTIGRDIRGKRCGSPTFGKNVCIKCNSTIVGAVSIGDDVLIAPNTFVNFDVPCHSVVIGNPATIHPRDCATEGFLGNVNE